jgi:hypothetical protein
MAQQINKGAAPICNANPDQPTFPAVPPTLFNFVPPDANNPQSIAQAILQLQHALAALSNPAKPTNVAPALPMGGGAGAGSGGKGGGLGGGAKQPPQPPPDNQWQEKSRSTENVKVVNPDDDSQFVIVKEIVSITMIKPSTGDTFTLNRDGGK